MSIGNLIIDIYQNIININGNKILVLIDKNKKIWFALRQIFSLLEYKNIKQELKRIEIDENEIITMNELLKIIPNENNIEYNNMQPHMKMVSESGLFMLLDKSKKSKALALKRILYTEVLPSIRKTGEYKLNKVDKLKLKKLTKKIQLIQKEQYIKKLTTKKYTQYNNLSNNGFLYVLKVKILKNGKEKICYKIGYTSDLNKRLEKYKTGNPDIELVYQENVNVSKKQLEKCVLNLNIIKRLSSKNEIICNSSLEEIKNEINDCKKLIEKYK
jgi:prophage antirepressor-like protein